MLKQHGSTRSTRSTRSSRLARQSRTCRVLSSRVETSQVEFGPIRLRKRGETGQLIDWRKPKLNSKVKLIVLGLYYNPLRHTSFLDLL